MMEVPMMLSGFFFVRNLLREKIGSDVIVLCWLWRHCMRGLLRRFMAMVVVLECFLPILSVV
jgi:hypothetical protein